MTVVEVMKKFLWAPGIKSKAQPLAYSIAPPQTHMEPNQELSKGYCVGCRPSPLLRRGQVSEQKIWNTTVCLEFVGDIVSDGNVRHSGLKTQSLGTQQLRNLHYWHYWPIGIITP